MVETPEAFGARLRREDRMRKTAHDPDLVALFDHLTLIEDRIEALVRNLRCEPKSGNRYSAQSTAKTTEPEHAAPVDLGAIMGPPR